MLVNRGTLNRAKYSAQWEVINDFIDEYSLAACISGLRKPYFGYAQAARPKASRKRMLSCAHSRLTKTIETSIQELGNLRQMIFQTIK